MQIGELLGSGRDADVYAIDDSWVLRRNRDGRSQAREAAIMAHLRAHGYPVPAVRAAEAGADASADLVMERVNGPTLLEAAQAGEVDVAEVGATLAELLVRLHAVPPPRRAEAEADADADAQTSPDTAVLHLDLHPLNVIQTPAGPVVIDWTNTRPGPPAVDWGMSALILAQVALDGSELAALAGQTLTALLAHRPAGVVLDGGVLARVRALRAADPNNVPGDLDAAVALVTARVE